MNRAFNRMWFASIASNMADGITFTAVPLLAAQLTQDPFLISLVSACSFLPWLVFAIATGTLVDRVDKRKAIAVANAIRGVVIVVLAVLVHANSITIVLLLIAVFAMGCMETIADNATTSLVPALAGRAHLEQANARIEATMTVTQGMIAAPVGGFLFGAAAAVPFAVGAAGYGGAMILALFIPATAVKAAAALAARSRAGAAAVPPAAQSEAEVPDGGRGAASGTQSPAQPAAPQHWWNDAAEGFRFIMGTPRLRNFWMLSVVVGFANALSQAALVLYVTKDLHVPTDWYGMFTVALAIGGVIGAMSTRHIAARIGRGTTLLIASLGFGATSVLVGLAFNPWTGAIAVATWAFCVGLWNPIGMSARQRLVPHHLLGRVHGIWRTIGWGISPLGSLVGGLIARANLNLTWYVGGTLIVLATLMAARLLLSFNNDAAPDLVHDESPMAEGQPGAH